MTPRPLDTDADSWKRHTAALSRMDGPARLRVALELSETVREIRLAGIRARHPKLTPRGAIRRLIAEDYGVVIPDRG
ncbi:hypothetical protein V3331_11970 [Gaopeijia maritima]|uniref:hypothetical protein n=1 Tax=Gaopeijia maritima TaxID=3119007 RepID=UPI00324982AD